MSNATRFLWVSIFIISASCMLGSPDLFAANISHKNLKPTKHNRSVSSKHKSNKGPRDIWERIRVGMQIPRPAPVAPELAALLTADMAQTQSASTTNTSEKSSPIETVSSPPPVITARPQAVDCEPARLLKPRTPKMFPLGKKTNSLITVKQPTRVHVQLNVKPKTSKLKTSQTIANFDHANALIESTQLAQEMAAEDAAEQLIPTNSIDAEMQAFQSRVEKAEPLLKPQPRTKPPCDRNSLQTANFAESEVLPDFETIRRQADRYERVREFILRYSQTPGFLANITERSRPYIFHIVESLSKAKMPLELALLPIVESAYQPKAESPKSAAGLWQFIPSTGVDFHLKQTINYDDRLDIIASTHAAIQYLSFLKQRYKGDWLLALAAYNCGPGCIDAAITANHDSGLATDFWSLQLPDETQAYVPRLLALASIFASPGNYKIQFAKIKNEPYFIKVNVAEQIDIKHLLDKDFSAIAQLADLNPDQFNLLNPGYLGVALNSAQPSSFLIPVTHAKLLNQRLQMLAQMAIEEQKVIPEFSILRTSLRKNPSHDFSTPIVALDIQNPTENVDNHALSLVTNVLIKNSPKNSDEPPLITFKLDQAQVPSVRQNQDKTHNASPERIQTAPVALKKSNAAIHTLRKGETLKYLAQRYQVTEEALRLINHFSRNQKFQVGQAIAIPAKKIRLATNDKKEGLNAAKRQIN